LKDDPLETRNLATVPEHQPRMQELTARIRCWQEKTGDEVDF
jgi:hypothetical protein